MLPITPQSPPTSPQPSPFSSASCVPHLSRGGKLLHHIVVSRSYAVVADVAFRFLFTFLLFVVFSADLGGLPPVTARIPTAQMSPRVITTTQGKLRGILIARPGRQVPPVEAYLGLQYASTLGTDLRFMPPTSSMEKWEGVRVALKFRSVCPQPIPNIEELSKRMPRGRVDHFRRLIPFIEKQKQHEECLFLNIYTPVKDFNSSASPSPVVVFFHGESYDIGTGNAYDGSMLAAYGSVVVVTINYRLGVFGFLSTGDSNAPGNYGLLDQIAALHWIKENIGSFGGDPSDVTLLGHGYGAALVNLLMVSPITKDGALFRRVILHSGTALGTWSMVEQPMHFARRLAEQVNCTGVVSGGGGEDAASREGHHGTVTLMLQTTPTTPADGGDSNVAVRRMLGCLKRLPVEQLLSAAGHVTAPRFFTSFGPTVDGRSVLPHDIRRLTSDISDETGFGRVDLLVGVMKNEGFAYFNQTDVDDGIDVDRLRRILRTYVRNVYRYQRQYIYDVVLYQYQQDSDRRHHAASSPAAASTSSRDPEVIRDLVMEMIGDAQQAAPAVDLARRHAAASATAALAASTPATDYFGDAMSAPFGPSGSRRRGPSPSPVPVYTPPAPSSTYLYVFGHQTRIDAYPRWADGVHADDLAYVFGAPVSASLEPGSLASEIDPFSTVYSRTDRALSETVMSYWTNFIRSGNPNEKTKNPQSSHDRSAPETTHDVSAVKRDGVHWPRYNAETQQYLQIGLEPTVRHHYRAEKMALWLGLVPRLHRATGPAAIASSTESMVISVNDDSPYHQLEDEDNLATFEDDNDDKRRAVSGHKPDYVSGNNNNNNNNNNGSHRSVDKASAKKYIAADMSETAQSPEILSPITGSGRKSARRTTVVAPTRHGTTTPGVPVAASIDNRSIMTSSQRRLPNDEEPSISGPDEPAHEHIALVATIATGCGALVLNCAVFAAVCVHRTRISRRSKSLPLPSTIGYGGPGASSAAVRTSSYKTAPNHNMRHNYSVSPFNGSSSLPVRNHRNGAPTGGHSIDIARLTPMTSSPLDVDDPMSSPASTSWPPVGTASTLPPPPPPQRTTAMASTLSPTSSTVDRRFTPTNNVNESNHYGLDRDNQDQNHQVQPQPQHQDYTITSLT